MLITVSDAVYRTLSVHAPLQADVEKTHHESACRTGVAVKRTCLSRPAQVMNGGFVFIAVHFAGAQEVTIMSQDEISLCELELRLSRTEMGIVVRS